MYVIGAFCSDDYFVTWNKSFYTILCTRMTVSPPVAVMCPQVYVCEYPRLLKIAGGNERKDLSADSPEADPRT